MNLPDLPNTKAANFLERVREALQTMMGKNNPEDRLITVGDLVNSGVADVVGGSITGGPPILKPPVDGGSGSGSEPPPVYVPDLSVPPTPTGFAVTAGLTAMFLETNPPAFTAGHGYARTLIYGSPYSETGPLPTYTEGTTPILTEFVGEVGDYPVDPGEQWHFWAKWRSIDGVNSVVAGGTNGVHAKSGLVGGSDLSDEIITADKLAAGAVDALDKFGFGLEPIYYYDVLPDPVGYVGVNTVYLTTDGKLYRYVGGAWTAAVPTTDLTGQIVNGQLAVNAVTSDKVMAGAIIAGKIAAATIVAGDGVISNAAITNALIANLAVTDAKISDLNVTKLKAGSIGVGEYIRSSSYVAGSAGWNIAGNGTAEFNTVTVRGAIEATSGHIGGAIIGTTLVKSSNYNFGTLGWLLEDNTGRMFANGGINGGDFSGGYVWPVSPTGKGFHLSKDGLLIGNANSVPPQYVQIDSAGNFYSPFLAMNAGGATFSGNLSAAGGTFKGSLTAASGTFVGALNAATGTFAGVLTAANAVVAGNITAGTITANEIIAGGISSTYVASNTTNGTTCASGTVTVPASSQAVTISFDPGGGADDPTQLNTGYWTVQQLTPTTTGELRRDERAYTFVGPGEGTFVFRGTRALYNVNNTPMSLIITVMKR